MKKVLIVGSGITSALTGYLLRQKLLTDLVHITIWDKARGAGGRMTTSRSNAVPNCKVDLGLQYITTTPDLLKEHEDIYGPLLNKKLLEPLRANIIGYKSKRENVIHYVTPEGSSSIVKFFLNNSNINEICYNTFLEKLQKPEGSQQIEAVSKEGKKDLFDIVVLTLPAPQVKELINRNETLSFLSPTEEYKALSGVHFSERYAFGMFFDIPFERPFDVKYFDNDDIIRYISFDNVKRNRPEEPLSVCVHTTNTFYGAYMELEENAENAKNIIESILLKKMREMFPSWPLPAETKLQKWKYSQVAHPHGDKLGYMKYNVKPLTLCMGDSFVSVSNFDNCIYSVKQGVDVLLEEIRS
uniref:Renalase n=1 Tax=Cacopsylla melanoneura TaxID=428564 RepID=A0A8D8TJF1_9HEMI